VARTMTFQITADDAKSMERKRKQVIEDLQAAGAVVAAQSKIIPNYPNTALFLVDVSASLGKGASWEKVRNIAGTYTSLVTIQGKKMLIKKSEAGAFARPLNYPTDRNTFYLRWRVLLRHEGFREYCNHTDTDDMKHSIGSEIKEWLERQEYYHVCHAIYGNINKLSFWEAWHRYQIAFAMYQDKGLMEMPIVELKPGTRAPEGRLNVSINPNLNRKDISRFFEKCVTKRRKHIALAMEADTLHGYFGITEKRVDFGVMKRYLAVWDLKQKYPQTWHLKAPKRFPEEYTGNRERNREKAYKDLARAKNIIEWAIRGRFPCTKPIK